MKIKNRIILAIDVDSAVEAAFIVDKLGPHVGAIKIGLEVITGIGAPDMLSVIRDYKAEAFYDGKFNDIPNTVTGATKPLAAQGVMFMNVHASSGIEAIRAAVKSCEGSKTKVLVVTVLTSISPEECQRIFGDTPENKVLDFARMAVEAGAHGLICSPKELKILAGEEFKNLLKVTPGIQPVWMQKNDQKRVATPGEAISDGADYLVIGRAITKPDKDGPAQGDPMKALKLINDEIEKAEGMLALEIQTSPTI